jgi:hypothetical protein
MPWYRLNDVGYDDPLVLAIGNAAYGANNRLGQYASAQRTDGWVPTAKVREICSRTELRVLTTVHIGDQPPMLHQPGDECACLVGKDWPAGMGGYWLHGFLRDNPSRAENDVHRAKRRELRDKALRQAVRDRDGDRCRYCGITVRWADRKTAAGGVLDHVDPAVAAGADNLVVACRGCNGQKKDCTPAAAGLVLLPPPGSTTDQARDQQPTSDGSSSDQPPDPKPISGPAFDPPPPTAAPNPPPSAATSIPDADQATPDTGSDARIRDEINGPMTTGQGRGGPRGRSRENTSAGDAGPAGHRPTIGPADTPRDALSPNPYLKSRTSNPAAMSTVDGPL